MNLRKSMKDRWLYVLDAALIAMFGMTACLGIAHLVAKAVIGKLFSDAHWAFLWVVGGLIVVSLVWLNEVLRAQGSKLLEFSLFKSSNMNVVYRPLYYRLYISVPFIIFFSVAMPVIVAIEELLFRVSVLGGRYGFPIEKFGFPEWVHQSQLPAGVSVLVWGGLVFGAVHILMGVTVRIALLNGMYGIFASAIFIWVSEQSGNASKAFWVIVCVHATYNYLVFFWGIFEIKLQAECARLLETESRLSHVLNTHLPTVCGWVTGIKTT